MNNLVKFGLLGLGGYILYKAFGEQIVSPTPGTTQVSADQPINTNNATNAATTTPQGSNNTNASHAASGVTSQQLYEAINFAVGSGATPDQWSYAFSHSQGGFSIDGGLMDRAFGPVGTVNRDRNYSVQEFIDTIKANGGTGLAGLRGLMGLTVARPSYFERAAKWRM